MPPILIDTLIILAKFAVIVMGFVMAVGSLLTFVERKQSAWIQNRVGPNRANFGGHLKGKKLLNSVRLGGVIHFLADGLKMLTKEDIIPAKANRLLHTVAPAIALFPAMVIFAVIPFMDYWCTDGALIVVENRDVCLAEAQNYFIIADLDVGFLYVFAIASMGVYGAAIAGWSSNSKFTLLGGLRSSAQMVSYEVPMGLSVLGVVMIFGTLNLNEIVRGQGELLFGVLPMWGIFIQPLGFLIFFVSMIAETKRAPFDMPEGESEIVAGYLTEYSSMKFAVISLSEFIAVVFVAAIVATLFLGGWQVPYLYGDGFHVPHWGFYPVTGVILTTVAGYFLMSAATNRRNRLRETAELHRLFGDECATPTPRGEVLTGAIGAFALVNAAVFFVFTATHVGGYQEIPYPVVVGMRIGAMLTKVLVLCWLQLMIRWTLPKFRYDQVMKLGWKVLLPAAILNLFLTAAILIPLYG